MRGSFALYRKLGKEHREKQVAMEAAQKKKKPGKKKRSKKKDEPDSLPVCPLCKKEFPVLLPYWYPDGKKQNICQPCLINKRK